jgi:chromosomal replication initiation ATPase DnaA
MRILVSEIIAATAEVSGVPIDQLITPTRGTCRVSEWRHKAMYVAARVSGQSLPAIGRAFGRDHSTIHFAVAKIEGLRLGNPPGLDADIARISLRAAERATLRVRSLSDRSAA